MRDVKAQSEMIEGPEAWDRFQTAMKRIVQTPHGVIQARIEEHKREAARNPHKRGPKPKK